MPDTSEMDKFLFIPQVENSIARVRDSLPRLYALAQGGTAVGTGLNTKLGFAEKFAQAVADDTGELQGEMRCPRKIYGHVLNPDV